MEFPRWSGTASEALVAADQDSTAHLAAVELLLDDRELARRLGGAARERVARDFSAERMAASSLEIYQRVVEQAGSMSTSLSGPGKSSARRERGPVRSVLGWGVRALSRRRETARRQREHLTLLAELSAANSAVVPDGARPRLLAIASWSFPVYSQSFVYQELAALDAAGFDVRLAYTADGEPQALPPQCAALATRALRLPAEPAITRRDLAHFRSTRPAAVAALLALLSRASGRSERQLLTDDHLLRAFSLARIAEAWGAELVHSYFFYEGSLAAFVVQQLLGLPRGVTCYADHLLDDYRLKLVPLQLARADLVVATCRARAPGARAPRPDLRSRG